MLESQCQGNDPFSSFFQLSPIFLSQQYLCGVPRSPHLSPCPWCALTPACKRDTQNTQTCSVWVGVLCGVHCTALRHAGCRVLRVNDLPALADTNLGTWTHKFAANTHTYTHAVCLSLPAPHPHTHTHTHRAAAPSLRGQELKPPVIGTHPCLPVSLRGWVPVTLTTWNYNPNGMSGVSSVSKRTMRIYFLLWTWPPRDLPQKQEVTAWLAFLQPN